MTADEEPHQGRRPHMRIIDDKHRRQMEEILGHAFASAEREPAEKLSALSQPVRDVAGQLLRQSRPLAELPLDHRGKPVL